MAKQNGAKKAAKRSTKKLPARPAQPAPVEVPERDASDRELRNGIATVEPLIELVRQLVREGTETTRREMQRLGAQVRELQARLREVRSAAEDSGPAASSTRLLLIQGWREQSWSYEDELPQEDRLPRPTLVGRALFDLVATHAGEKPELIEIFGAFERGGQHHLSEKIVRLMAQNRTLGPENKDLRGSASSALSKAFNRRYKLLCRGKLADSGRGSRFLLDRGRDVFDGWPDWSVQDDAPWDCFGRVQTEAPAPQPSSPPPSPSTPPPTS